MSQLSDKFRRETDTSLTAAIRLAVMTALRSAARWLLNKYG